MNTSGAQRIVPVILIIIIIVIAVAAVFSLGKGIFGGSSSEEKPVSDSGQTALLSTTADRSVRMTVRGPIVGDNTFHSYAITISPNARTLTTYQGYLDSQVDSMQLTNNVRGYEQFVHALDRAGLTKNTELTGDADDRRGVCATGMLYVYEIIQGSNAVKTLWTTTCDSARGSLKIGNESLSSLFRAQVPDWSKLTSKVRL